MLPREKLGGLMYFAFKWKHRDGAPVGTQTIQRNRMVEYGKRALLLLADNSVNDTALVAAEM
jgi:hypothetical protein